MKIEIKIFYAFAIALFSGLIICSCNKPNEVVFDKEGKIYIPRAANSAKMGLFIADTPQVFVFSAAYGGLKYPSKDISVNFDIDSAAVNSYNALNGTSYTLLPANSYSVPSLDAVIKAGTTTSNALQLKLTTSVLDQKVKYILPISIKNVSGGFIDSALHTTYFIIDTIQRLEKDITSNGQLSVSRDNGGGPDAGEGSKKLVDGNNNSKFLTEYFSDMWVQLSFPSPVIVGAYTITSGNDAPDRDPKDWQLMGSNDGTSWTTIDNISGETFAGRNMVKRYETTNHTPYLYYRMAISANNGSSLIQISEWRLITYP